MLETNPASHASDRPRNRVTAFLFGLLLVAAVTASLIGASAAQPAEAMTPAAQTMVSDEAGEATCPNCITDQQSLCIAVASIIVAGVIVHFLLRGPGARSRNWLLPLRWLENQAHRVTSALRVGPSLEMLCIART